MRSSGVGHFAVKRACRTLEDRGGLVGTNLAYTCPKCRLLVKVASAVQLTDLTTSCTICASSFAENWPPRTRTSIREDMKRLPIVLIALLTVLAFSQTKDRSATELESETEARVASLFKRFGELLQPTAVERQLTEACKTDCAKAGPQPQDASARAAAEGLKAMNAVASQIHAQIDTYIARAVHPSHVDPREVTRHLKQILGSAEDDLPSAFVINGDNGPSLIVAYNLLKGGLMGVGGTSVTLRAYVARQGAFRLVAATGKDMDGYVGVSFIKLNSTGPNELWLLLSGLLSGANGHNNRMRLYSYAQAEFRTVWAPENAWGDFTVRVTEKGFTINGAYARETRRRHDLYFVEEDGVTRLSPEVVAAH